MSETLSDTRLAELRAVAEKATPGVRAVEDRRNASLKNIRVVAGKHELTHAELVAWLRKKGQYIRDVAQYARNEADTIGAVVLLAQEAANLSTAANLLEQMEAAIRPLMPFAGSIPVDAPDHHVIVSRGLSIIATAGEFRTLAALLPPHPERTTPRE